MKHISLFLHITFLQILFYCRRYRKLFCCSINCMGIDKTIL